MAPATYVIAAGESQSGAGCVVVVRLHGNNASKWQFKPIEGLGKLYSLCLLKAPDDSCWLVAAGDTGALWILGLDMKNATSPKAK
jgi:hypothetical protein